MRRIHLEEAVIAREIPIVRQTKMSLRIPTDQKGVVLRERKNAALVRAGGDFQIDLHCGLAIDSEIVKHHFVNVARVESDATTPVFFRVSDTCQKLAVRIKR